MTKRSSLRASDADRDRVVERLHQAISEGRLLTHEFEERLGRTLRARTYGDLDAVVADLPGGSVAMVATRPNSLRLVPHYPVGIAVIGLIVGIAAISAFAAVVAVIASAAWLLPLIVFLVLRARLLGPRPHRSRSARMYADGRRTGRY